MTDAEIRNTLVSVLWGLMMEDRSWESNYRFVLNRNTKEVNIWWSRAQLQARKGVPSMQALMARFIAHQLTE